MKINLESRQHKFVFMTDKQNDYSIHNSKLVAAQLLEIFGLSRHNYWFFKLK